MVEWRRGRESFCVWRPSEMQGCEGPALAKIGLQRGTQIGSMVGGSLTAYFAVTVISAVADLVGSAVLEATR